MNEPVLCKECRSKGQKSRVFHGASMTTLLYCQPYYDEDGRYHNHDSNRTTTELHCSNGHSWTEISGGTCWCGWKGMV